MGRIYAQPVFVKNLGINDGDLKFVKITDYNKKIHYSVQ